MDCKTLAFSKKGKRRDSVYGDQRTSAGTNEREEKLFAVMPTGPSSEAVVTMVTPETKRLNASRNMRVLPSCGLNSVAMPHLPSMPLPDRGRLHTAQTNLAGLALLS